ILERVLYSHRPERYEYQLTQKGRDLLLPLLALQQWGDKYLSEKPPTLLRRKSDKKPIIAALVPKATSSVPVEETETAPGPGRNPAQRPPPRGGPKRQPKTKSSQGPASPAASAPDCPAPRLSRSPQSRTERRGGQPSTGAQNRRSAPITTPPRPPARSGVQPR